jgi:hypothetical protein
MTIETQVSRFPADLFWAVFEHFPTTAQQRIGQLRNSADGDLLGFVQRCPNHLDDGRTNVTAASGPSILVLALQDRRYYFRETGVLLEYKLPGCAQARYSEVSIGACHSGIPGRYENCASGTSATAAGIDSQSRSAGAHPE